MELKFNIDGMTPYKSSYKTIWPILCQIHDETYVHQPFTVALYAGSNKLILILKNLFRR